MYVLLETNNKNQIIKTIYTLQLFLMDRLIVLPPCRNRSVLFPTIHTLIIPTPIAFLLWVFLIVMNPELVPVAETLVTLLTLIRPGIRFTTYFNMHVIPGLLPEHLFAILADYCRILHFGLFLMFLQFVFWYFCLFI